MVPDYNETYEKNFEKLRSQQEFIEDASRKSSIDAHCRDMCNELNDTENYFTTSSCSGRFLAFAQVFIATFQMLNRIQECHDLNLSEWNSCQKELWLDKGNTWSIRWGSNQRVRWVDSEWAIQIWSNLSEVWAIYFTCMLSESSFCKTNVGTSDR